MDTADLLDSAPCGYLAFGDDGRLERVNQTLLEMLGYDRAGLIGRHIEHILAVGTRIFYQTHWFPLLRMHGRAEEIFLILRSSTGENVGVLSNAVRRDRDGAVAYECIVMRVRERQKYEDELLRARRAADTASAELEVQKRELEEANRRLHAQSEALEHQRDELEAQAEELEFQAEELLATSEELRRVNRELEERTEEAEQLRSVAEEANLAKSRYLAVMSHELRTPLNAISGYSQLLEMGIHGPVTEAQLEVIGRIRNNQKHLLTLINDVLDLARIEAGRVEYLVEEVPVPDMVSAVLPIIEPLFHEKSLAFETFAPADLVVRADREKTQQILLNLLGNAVKFTEAGGRVSIRAGRADGVRECAHLRVQDTGVGIPADQLGTVFEPFVQVGARSEATAKGSGLGLAISRDLARGMGGDLTAESVPGEGSTFTLTLPLRV